MKSMRQRLQSRISKRRNAIRENELTLALWKAVSKTNPYRKLTISTLRDVIKLLAADQKLDRELYQMVVVEERYARMDEMIISTFRHDPLFMEENAPVVLELISLDMEGSK